MPRPTPHLPNRLPNLLLQRLLGLLLCLFLAAPGLAGMDDNAAHAAGFSHASLLDAGPLQLEAEGGEGDDSKELPHTAAAPPNLPPAVNPARPGKQPGHDLSRLRAHPPRAPPRT